MEEENEQSKRPSNNPIKQQRLNAFQPSPTVKSAVFMFVISGTFLLIFGIVMKVSSDSIIEVIERYDDVTECKGTINNPRTCTIKIDVDEDMSEPVYLYYQLTNFYQNHRNYVKSRSNAQLAGDDLSSDKLDTCDPVKDVGDLDLTVSHLDKDDTAIPCGLAAKTIFTDYFVLQDDNGNQIDIDEDDIAWQTDKDFKFENVDLDDQWLDMENEHFIVWMRIASLPNFRKLWGKIDDDLDEGTYYMQINSSFDVSDWDGEKHIVLSTSNGLGGKNDVLGIIYLTFGCVFYVCAGLFLLRDKCGKTSSSKELIW